MTTLRDIRTFARYVSRRWLWPLLIAAATLSPLNALAQIAAITTEPVNMRAGPDREFPLVAWLPGGTPVSIVGCIDNWHWCDVVSGFSRGWIYAHFLSMVYRNQPTVILGYGAMLGVPLITFSVNNYWGTYYRNRPWWNNRSYWAGRPPTWQHPPYRPPPRPTPRPPTIQPVPSPGQPGGRPPSSGRPPPSGTRPPSTDRPPSSGRPPSNGRPPSGGKPPRDNTSPTTQGSG